MRQFLISRRARLSPQQAGLAAFGDNRRVPGLRREEVATLAGVSIAYYTRLERGNLTGVSESVLDEWARLCSRLAECLGVLGEQADQEVDPAEVAVRQAI